jgi:hypothetical protein
MTEIDHQLARLAKAIELLPAEAQADVLAEIEARVDSLSEGRMTDAQRAIVLERSAGPMAIARREDVQALPEAMKMGE